MYDLDREDWMARAAEDTQLYQIISVDGPNLIYQARTATGRLYDAFVLRKQPDGPNVLTDAHPRRARAAPARRRELTHRIARPAVVWRGDCLRGGAAVAAVSAARRCRGVGADDAPFHADPATDQRPRREA